MGNNYDEDHPDYMTMDCIGRFRFCQHCQKNNLYFGGLGSLEIHSLLAG